ncbi:MAG: response regulator [Actinobacteria bacterium]|nr:response regulator [Actinomycetota bacterium]
MAKRKIKILLVEDDSFLLSMYAAKFELEDFKVITAEDGESGLELANKELPCIILLDIMLPKMSGFEVLRKLKSDEKFRKIPVILLTNLSQKNDIDKGLGMKADDYLIKAHFTPSEVVRKVKQILERR